MSISGLKITLLNISQTCRLETDCSTSEGERVFDWLLCCLGPCSECPPCAEYFAGDREHPAVYQKLFPVGEYSAKYHCLYGKLVCLWPLGCGSWSLHLIIFPWLFTTQKLDSFLKSFLKEFGPTLAWWYFYVKVQQPGVRVSYGDVVLRIRGYSIHGPMGRGNPGLNLTNGDFLHPTLSLFLSLASC